MKKKIELAKKVIDLRGKEMLMSPDDPNPITVGKVLGLIIDADKGKKINALKKWNLAVECYGKEEAVFDEADIAIMKGLVEAQEMFTNASAPAQALKALEDAEEVK